MDLRQYIEHTNLNAAATERDISNLCQEAMSHGLFGVCVAPLFVPRCRTVLENSGVRLVSVVGFPLGSTNSEVKAYEARQLVEAGADELDMVIPVGLALSGKLDDVRRHVRAVREAAPSVVLKVILETGHFEPNALTELAKAVVAEGPEFLKTSTGFGPRGATEQDVRLLSRAAKGHAKIKASSGIRSRAQALAMLEAGASRLGTSCGVALLSE